MSDHELPNFEELADELLADVAAGNFPGDTRGLLVAHGRLMFSEGVRAAKALADELAMSTNEALSQLAEEADGDE